jgi:TPR repeat protein
MSGDKKENIANALSRQKQLQKEITALLDGKSFAELSFEQQLQYCRLNKKFMGITWRCFKITKENKEYKAAALYFNRALELGFHKAVKLHSSLTEASANAIQEVDIQASADASENFQRSLFAHLGLGTPQNREIAFQLLQLAAQQGHAGAQNNLGFAYELGQGVKKNQKQAVYWYRKAAEQGHVGAKSNMGYAYYYGKGVKQDEKQAVYWYQKAAEQGFTRALSNLEEMRTPRAFYALALLRKNETTALKLVMTHVELQCDFFKNHFINMVCSKQKKKKLSQFLENLLESIKTHETHPNAFLINTLLSLHKIIKIIRHNKDIIRTMNALVPLIQFADADAKHILNLMSLINDINYENEEQPKRMELLITLWHQAQALQITIDDTNLNIMAHILVKHYFKSDDLMLDTQITNVQLHRLIFAYKAMPNLSAAQLSELLTIIKSPNIEELLQSLNILSQISFSKKDISACYSQLPISEVFKISGDNNGKTNDAFYKRIQKQLKQEITTLLDGKSFTELNFDQQLQFCRLNKKLMKNTWSRFEIAKENKNYKIAALYFNRVLVLGFEKAMKLYVFLGKTISNRMPEVNIKASMHASKNFKKGLLAQLDLENNIAFQYFQFAALQGHTTSQNNLGYAFDCGVGVKQDLKQAIHWYKKAANKGFASAQYNLGQIYTQGKKGEPDLRQGAYWYTLAAEQGFAHAQDKLGSFYFYEGDYGQGIHWYTLAAEQGLACAQYKLGLCYYHGAVVMQNQELAVRWFRKAAEQGNPSALTNLKKISPALALYTEAVLEKNEDKIINLVITHDELQHDFFANDFINIARSKKDEGSLNVFLLTLMAKRPHVFPISILLSFEHAIRKEIIERNEHIATIMTELMAHINFAYADAKQLPDLIFFICNVYYESKEHQDVLEPLIALWHRAQALKLSMQDTDLNTIMARIFVRYYYKNDKYDLLLNAQITNTQLHALVCAIKADLLPKILNNFLDGALIDKSKIKPNKISCKGLLQWMNAAPPKEREPQSIIGQRRMALT